MRKFFCHLTCIKETIEYAGIFETKYIIVVSLQFCEFEINPGLHQIHSKKIMQVLGYQNELHVLILLKPSANWNYPVKKEQETVGMCLRVGV